MARKKKEAVAEPKHKWGTLYKEPKLMGYACTKCGLFHKEKPMVQTYRGYTPRMVEGTCICGSRDFKEIYQDQE